MFGEYRLDDRDLRMRRGAQSIPFLRLGDGVLHPLVVGHRHPDLDALGRGDPSLSLDIFPGSVITLWTDQAEDVTLTAVLPDQGGGEAESSSRLQIGGHPEHWRRQQVHFVIDDQAPVAAVEQFEVAVLTLGSSSDHLIGGDRDGSDLLALPGVLADLGFGQRCPGDQLPFPLTACNGVGDQDQCGGACLGHSGGTHQRLTGPAGQYHHA